MEIPDDCEIGEDALQYVEVVEENSNSEILDVINEDNVAEYEFPHEIQQLPVRYQHIFQYFLETANRKRRMQDPETNHCSHDSMDTGVQSQTDIAKETFTPLTTPEPDDCDKTLVPELSTSINGFEALNACANQSMNLNSEESADDSDELLNPFNINFAHIYDKIFDYLDVTDILNLSQVCRGFYNLIGIICRKQMSRVKLVVNETHNRRVRDELMGSTRKYQHIEIRGLFDSTNEISMLVQSIADSLVTVRTSYDFPCPFNMPSLQEIAFTSRDFNKSAINFAKDGILRASFKAKRLYVWIRADNPGLMAAYIRENYNLEKVVLEQNSSWQIISELDNFNDYQCKLQTLHVDLGVSEVNKSRNLSQSFFGFIAKQKDYLREIKFGGDFQELSDVLKILPHLEKITFALKWRSHLNVSVAHPHLMEANLISVPWQFVKEFLEQNPRIEKLYVSQIDKHLLKQIVAVGSKIKVLRFALLFEDCDLDHLKQYYELIRDSMPTQSTHMEIIQI